MKTTVEIPDSLFQEAKACAEARGVPFRRILEEGLRAVIQAQEMAGRFRLRDGSFGEPGGRVAKPWASIRETIYEGRGE